MTLMLRPDAWAPMYHASPAGLQLNTGDATVPWRWLFFIAGAFPCTGAALGLLALAGDKEDPARQLLRRTGAFLIAIGIVVESAFAWLSFSAQPPQVLSQVMSDPLYRPLALRWPATAVLLLLGAVAVLSRTALRFSTVLNAVVVFLNIAAVVMVRDGIRDYTLRAAGFDVWNQQVVTNWSVVGLFLLLLLTAAGILAWLVTVIGKARRLEESYV